MGALLQNKIHLRLKICRKSVCIYICYVKHLCTTSILQYFHFTKKEISSLYYVYWFTILDIWVILGRVLKCKLLNPFWQKGIYYRT